MIETTISCQIAIADKQAESVWQLMEMLHRKQSWITGDRLAKFQEFKSPNAVGGEGTLF